jgi:glycosyltransferase involved in cell wall biosynthesis/O-antigen/teichoic acid export membrane protein/O-antigen ligase
VVKRVNPRSSRPSHEALALVVRWFLVAMLVVLPLDVYIVLPPHQPIAFLSQILAAEALIVLGIAVFAARMLKRATSLALTWADALPLGLILLASLISLGAAASPGEAAKGCLKVAVYLSVYLVASAVRSTPGMRPLALTALVLGALVVMVAGALSANPNAPDLTGVLLNIQRTPAALPNSDVLRAEATFRYPNELAAYLLLTLPLLLAYALRAPSKVERVSFWVLTAIGFWVLTLTYTRGALIAFFVVCPILFFLLCDRKIALAGTAVTLVAALGLALYAGGQSERILSVLAFDDTGYTLRFATWPWALDTFIQHPFIGVGLENLRYQPNAPYADVAQTMRAVDAENLYLNVLAELGLVGAIPIFVALAGALRRAWRGLRAESGWIDASWNAGVLGALIGVLVYGLVDPVLISGQVTALLCALVGLAGPLAYQTQRSSPGGALASAPARALDEAPTEILSRAAARPLASRVVFLINATGFGGVEKHTYGLAAELRRRGVDTLVVCPPGAQFIQDLAARGIPYRALEIGMNAGRVRGWLGTLALLNPLSRRRTRREILALAAETPSIFYCAFPREQVLVTRLGAPTVWTVHAPLRYAPHRLIVQPMLNRVAARAGAIVAITNALALSLARSGMPRSRIHMIPNAVANVRAEGSAPPVGRPGRIGVASRLTREKGVQHVIAAMPAILRAHPFATLLIAGSGRYLGSLRAQVRRLGLGDHVRFTGYLPDTEPFFQDLSVFVCPSVDRAEGLPTVILEAMRVGLPVVATAIVDGVLDVVVDRRTGLLAPPADPVALAQSVNALLSDARMASVIGASGRELVRARYTFERAAAQFLGILGSVEQSHLDGGEFGHTSLEVRRAQGASLITNTTVFLVSKVLTALATALWTVLAARSLLPAQYGNLMLAAGLVDLGAVITDVGLTSVATRDLASATPRSSRATIGALIYLKIALGALAAVAILGVTLLVPFEADARKVMLVLGPSLVLVSLQSLTLVFQARLATGYVLVAAFLGALVSVWGATLVYWTGPTPLRFAAVRLAMVGVAGLMTLLLTVFKYRPTLRPDWNAMGRMLSASLLLGLALVLNVLYYRIDVPLLALLTDSTQVAIYASAYRILDVVTLLPVAAAGVALPLMAAARKANVRHLAEFTRQYLELALAAGLLIAVALTIFRQPLLTFLYGGYYDASAPTLLVLAWVAAATLVTNVFTPLAVALNRQRTLLAVTALGLAVNLAANVALIPRYGAVAAAYATLVTEVAVTVPLIVVAVRSVRLRLITRPIAAAAAATVTALLVSFLGSALFPASWITGVVAVVVWLVMTPLIAPRWIPNLVSAIRNRGEPPPQSTEHPLPPSEPAPILSRSTS